MKTSETIINKVDLHAFDILYYKYHHAVYSNIWKMVKHNEAAEDILQEVFMALWQNRQTLDAEKVGGWLFVTSYNKTVKYLKKKQKEKNTAVEKAGFYNELLQEEPLTEEWHSFQLSLVEEAVNHLPGRKKQVFTLCRFQGMSCDDVAKILGISVTSVKDYLKQSNRFIKEYISRNYAERSIIITSSLLLIYLA